MIQVAARSLVGLDQDGDSGTIEQDTDLVTMLFKKDDQPGRGES